MGLSGLCSDSDADGGALLPAPVVVGVDVGISICTKSSSGINISKSSSSLISFSSRRSIDSGSCCDGTVCGCDEDKSIEGEDDNWGVANGEFTGCPLDLSSSSIALIREAQSCSSILR